MGLDQNAYKVSQDGEREELAYWRKHNRLQGWMEERYTNKGGTEQFNCVDLELDEDDILDLEVAIDDKELPETGGFFFGNDSYTYYDDEYGDKETDRKFIKDAKAALDDGWKIVYSCWW